VDHLFCRQPPTRRDHRMTCRQASDLTDNSSAFSQDRWPASSVNCAIDSTSAQKR
jgi:hypothetical protein